MRVVAVAFLLLVRGFNPPEVTQAKREAAR
jgi:hypothetical protein